MDREHYIEMCENLNDLEQRCCIKDKIIYLFGHCNATEELVDLFLEKGFFVKAILDNNISKHGNLYRSIPIVLPKTILEEKTEETIVCIVARAYEAMKAQLREIGFTGEVIKLVDYNSYAEYSLSDDTIFRKRQRVERGIRIKEKIELQYPDYFKILCPFSALGDVFFAMSYVLHFAKMRKIAVEKIVYCVIGSVCGQVVSLFGASNKVLCFSQKEMDELVQACLYTEDKNSFIAHQDRPYVVNLHRALYIKCIPLEVIYRCGVFGLPIETKPFIPENLKIYPELRSIKKGEAVVLSPYAKSVTLLPEKIWEDIISYYKNKGYQCLTNVVGNEKPLNGTIGISPALAEMQSVIEWAGVFIGIRSGLCDVIKYANCQKIALFPDYNYCDTKWKAIDMYTLEGWENIVIKDGFVWNRD